MRDTTIADKLRDAGLNVREVDGWQTRGSSTFSPRGFLWHHTAGPKSGNTPSLNICINGRAGLPGPLCNVYQARDNTVYVVAAGRANHAGAGSWKGLSGNASVYGLEVENVGTAAEPWRWDQLVTAAQVAAALGVDTELCCMHKEWTTRKIDMHTVSGADMRKLVAEIKKGPASPPEATIIGVPDMFLILEGVGLFAVVDGIPIGFPNLAAYAAARDASSGVPVMTLKGDQAKSMFEWLLKKLNASVA